MGHHNNKNKRHSVDPNTGFIVSGNPEKKGHKHSLKKISLVTVSVLIIALLIFGVYTFINRTPSRVCSDEIIQQAAGAISENNVENLKSSYDRVIAENKYQTDPNCMYIVTNYFIRTGDYQQSRQSLEELKKVYNQEEGYSPLFGLKANDPDQLEPIVNFLEERATTPVEGFFVGGQP